MAKIPSRFRSVDRHIQDFMQTIITAFNNQETKVGNAIGKGWDTAIHSIKEAWEKATGVVSAHSDITSAGAQIEDAVTKKHTEGKLKADSTDPTAGFLDEKIDDSLVLVSETHKIRVQKLDGGTW